MGYGSALKDLNPITLEKVINLLKLLAEGRRDEITITRLSQLDIDVPFRLPLWNDKEGNDRYWPQVQKWAHRQLGMEGCE